MRMGLYRSLDVLGVIFEEDLSSLLLLLSIATNRYKLVAYWKSHLLIYLSEIQVVFSDDMVRSGSLTQFVYSVL